MEALRKRWNALSNTVRDANQINVASVSLALSGDRCDGPLRPRARLQLDNPPRGG